MNVTACHVKMELLVQIHLVVSCVTVQRDLLDHSVIWTLTNVLSTRHVKMGLLASTIMAPSFASVQPVTLEACVI